ncbi:MAG TPA: helix-turn-helix transcriptional regulator [Nitrospiria bacterium]|nr:helix-turn-helix transcriptional regulator [Nitrospiria bacterium]
MAMQDLSAYLQSLKEQLNIRNNGELAARLNIDEQRVSRWCQGEELPDDDSCIKLASMAGDDPAKVLILKHLSSASITARSFWEKVSIKYRHGRTFPKSLDKGSQYDRRHKVLQFTGADRRSPYDRRRELDRRLGLAI